MAGAANDVNGFSLAPIVVVVVVVVVGCVGPGIGFTTGSVEEACRGPLFNASTLSSLDELSARIRISSEKELADRAVELQFTENAASSNELSNGVSCHGGGSKLC